jgi:hypothetical protein
MPTMYRAGTQEVNAHPSQVENMKRSGWSLEKQFKKPAVKETAISKTKKEGV